ncbi:pentatricopeptide repeat-containing protein At1g50270 [Selaginella moellendorffii]|uniref:pentatricopeptide repeat-containing protein At1g50270 n=1 Tax=Selaginella moellendorffii TaxID=88036 RepID=UPI000D1C9FE5|nr:pentatricopeptide repeat-containing protein At1g50270 [Selaginella moellendorffii]|eukprot:XP_024517448.1 pentatricopeptide repeat-containing protein At1g50270 [Selaginella moellendorffii]
MLWRHLQPLRKKRALAAAAVDILAQRNPAPRSLPPWPDHGGDHGGDRQQPRAQVNVIHIFASLLRKCDSPAALEHGKRIHAQLIAACPQNLSQNLSMAVLLIRMYGKCGSPGDAKAVFDDLCVKDGRLAREISLWNSLLTGFVHNRKNKEALRVYKELCDRGRDLDLEPSAGTLVQALVACSSLRDLGTGKAIHSRAIALGCDRQNGHLEETMGLYRRMAIEGVAGGADACTLSIVLSVCKLGDARQIHARAIVSGLESHAVVGTALVRSYGRWGSVGEAMAAFDQVESKDVVCWTAIMAVLVARGLPDRAVELYRGAIARGVEPDCYTLSTILGACRDLETGQEIHRVAAARACDRDAVVGTALVAMYGRCKRIDEAKRAFDRIQGKNVVSWNAILAAYAEAGLDAGVLELLDSIDVVPDVLVFSKALAACASLGDLAVGRRLHDWIVAQELESETTVENGLISMYARCGSWGRAKAVFARRARDDPVSWNAIISAAARFNQLDLVLDLLREMSGDGVDAGEITFTSVLHACAHAGVAMEGVEIFKLVEEFGCEAIPDHFHCLIDLFGRLGMMEEAEALIDGMPFEPDLVAWTSLAGACKLHRDLDRAARCAENVAALNMRISGPFVLLCSIWNDPDEEILS